MLHEVQKLFNGNSSGFTIVREGHFALSSGLHTSRYVDVKKAMSCTPVRVRIAREMALPFVNRDVEVVIGSGPDGALLSSAVSHMSHLKTEIWWDCAWTTKEDGVLSIPERARDFVAGKNVLVVDDVLTTGKTLENLNYLVEQEGGRTVGMAVVCRRNTEVLPEAFHVFSVQGKEYDAVPREECLLCKDEVPVDEIFGHSDLI